MEWEAAEAVAVAKRRAWGAERSRDEFERGEEEVSRRRERAGDEV